MIDDINIGDKVWVELFVSDIVKTEGFGTSVGVYTGSGNLEFYVTKDAIKKVCARAFRVGDLVKSRLTEGIFKIIAIHKEQCWVEDTESEKTNLIHQSHLKLYKAGK